MTVCTTDVVVVRFRLISVYEGGIHNLVLKVFLGKKNQLSHIKLTSKVSNEKDILERIRLKHPTEHFTD